MPTVLKSSISRWGYSVYERTDDIKKEKKELGNVGRIVDDLIDAEILITHSKQRFSIKELERAPSAKLIITTTSGTDHIDKEALKKRGVRLVRMPMIRRDAVVETTMALLLDALRLVWRFQEDARQNQWSRGRLPEYMPRRISDIEVGVVGYGVIGTRLVEVLAAFGSRISVTDPKGVPERLKQRSFAEMAETCQAVLFACDLNPSSLNMVNRAWLEACPEGMILVNTARGGLIDVNAAKEALESGTLGFLGLDVYPKEPFEHLDWVNQHPNLHCLPHSAGFHPQLAEMIRHGLVDIVGRYLAGEAIQFEVIEAT